MLYSDWAADVMAELHSGAVVLDIGAGRRSALADLRPERVRLVAVDVSVDELARNADITERVVADATRHLPFTDASVDMVASKFLLEHLADVEGFIRESARVLRPGGMFIHVFPATFAPFAMLGRLIPSAVATRLLAATLPETKETRRFKAEYDRCYAGAIVQLLEQHGFVIERLHVSWYQSHYFKSLLPLFVASVLYELAVWMFQVRDLGAYLVVMARRDHAG